MKIISGIIENETAASSQTGSVFTPTPQSPRDMMRRGF